MLLLCDIDIIAFYSVEKSLLYNRAKFESDTFNSFCPITSIKSKNIVSRKTHLKF